MSDPKQARMLLELAKRDISALHGMGDPSVFADEVFGFNVQQAVEKLFKAWLSVLGVTYPPVHDLRRLFNMVSSRDPDSVRFEALIDYTPYAVQFRYEFRDSTAEVLDRDEALRQTEALREAVCERLTRFKPKIISWRVYANRESALFLTHGQESDGFERSPVG